MHFNQQRIAANRSKAKTALSIPAKSHHAFSTSFTACDKEVFHCKALQSIASLSSSQALQSITSLSSSCNAKIYRNFEMENVHERHFLSGFTES